MKINHQLPGVELYIKVRQGFVGQSSSLNRFCNENKISRRNAEACLKGMWNGPKGVEMRDRIIKASGISSAQCAETQSSTAIGENHDR